MTKPTDSTSAQADSAPNQSDQSLHDAPEKRMPDGNSHPSDGYIDDPDVVEFAGEAATMVRARSEKVDPTEGKIVAAVNLAGDTSQLSDSWRKTLGSWWAGCCSRVSRPEVDWCKAGGVMWDHAQIDVPADWIAWMTSLKAIDKATERAVMAGLFGAVSTTVGPVDIDSVLHGITTFIHTHPAFADVTKEGKWELPFGEHTAYMTATVGDDGCDEEADATNGASEESRTSAGKEEDEL
jgi:hypothetical protein